MLERVIEEHARGDPTRAASVRRKVAGIIGDNLRSVRFGSAEATRVKEVLQAEGLWSQYLEVGIGADAEIFTKSQPMSAVGDGFTLEGSSSIGEISRDPVRTSQSTADSTCSDAAGAGSAGARRGSRIARRPK